MRISDWSSDVCSSDLPAPASARAARRSDQAQVGSGTRWRSCTAPPTPAARSAPWSPCSAPARVEPVRSPLFSKDVLDDLVLENLLGQQLLQPAVLGLKLLQALGIGHAHAAELAPPQLVRRLAEAVLAAQLLDRQSGLDRKGVVEGTSVSVRVDHGGR